MPSLLSRASPLAVAAPIRGEVVIDGSASTARAKVITKSALDQLYEVHTSSLVAPFYGSASK